MIRSELSLIWLQAQLSCDIIVFMMSW